MGLNFREALAVLYRGLSAVLFRAGVIAAGGFVIIVAFGMMLFVFRLAGGVSRGTALASAVLLVLGVSAGGLLWQRIFLFRLRAAMLVLFSGRSLTLPALTAASRETKRFFKNYSQWQALNLWLRKAISSSGPAGGQGVGFCIVVPLSQAALVLAFFRDRGDIERSAREAVALFLVHGKENRVSAQKWHWLSVLGFLFLFLCMALPNWFFFGSAGAPVWIGIVLAAVIAWVLHQAFVIPFVLAGVSAALLAETRDKDPDPALCEKLALLTP